MRRIVALVVCALSVASATTSRGSCPVAGAFVGPNDNVTGTAVLTFDGVARTSDRASRFTLWAHDFEGWSPLARSTDAVDFAFTLVADKQSIATLRCTNASYAALARGEPIALADLCGQARTADVDAGRPNAELSVRAGDDVLAFDLSALQGTATATTTLTPGGDGNGVVTLRLAITDGALREAARFDANSGLARTATAAHFARFRTFDLTGVAKFADRADACAPSGGGGGGGCDCGGPATTWRPGGG